MFFKVCALVEFILFYKVKQKKYTPNAPLIFPTILLTLFIANVYIHRTEDIILLPQPLYRCYDKYILCQGHLIFVNIKKQTYSLSTPLAGVHYFF